MQSTEFSDVLSMLVQFGALLHVVRKELVHPAAAGHSASSILQYNPESLVHPVSLQKHGDAFGVIPEKTKGGKSQSKN